ncbi:MAG: alpha/beta hydrolase [Anaerostipes sp.]|nr:alpha/beta hydrolase [Anaerostipes sp.]MDD3746655.1 alpha/beta hydrolase [Anaerostipes sp.]
MIKKEKLEQTRPYAFEKKVLEREKNKGLPQIDKFYKNVKMSENLDVLTIRNDMKKEGEDITKSEIITSSYVVQLKHHKIVVYVYHKKDISNKNPAVLFFHGGGFFGGDVKTKENQCKYLAEQSDAVVVAPEYRLSPECAYPGAIEDGMGTLEWMKENADRLGIDRNRIAVMGESAGGTLAANVCFRDMNKDIKLAALIYGALDVSEAGETYYQWDYSKYKMDEEDKDYIMNRLYRFKELSTYMKYLYLNEGDDVTNPDISPIYQRDMTQMPKTLMIEAEFDYYRICNDEFVRKLKEQNVDVDVIFYEGLDHGFFDRLGSLPQTADCIEEIAKRVKEM